MYRQYPSFTFAKCNSTAFERAVAKHGTNIARIILARMLLRSIYKMLHDGVRFNQMPAA